MASAIMFGGENIAEYHSTSGQHKVELGNTNRLDMYVRSGTSMQNKINYRSLLSKQLQERLNQLYSSLMPKLE
jgi:hypothetical protein